MQQTVYKLSIGTTLSRYSCAGTMSFCQRCMAYLVQVVCADKFNASVLQNIINHAIGCYPCLFCIIGSDEMATPLSIRGYATRRTLETMYSDHQHYVAAGSIRRDAQKLFNSISLPIFNIPVSQVQVHV